jgi:tetratricopeptide (TPR) repeat protein
LKKDDKLAQELAESQAEKDAALQEVNRLKAALRLADVDKAEQEQYNQAVNLLQASDAFEQGTALTVAGRYEEAARTYDRVIYLRPDDAKAYFNRGIVHINLGNYNSATADINRAMLLNSADTDNYYQRAIHHKNIREARLTNQQQLQQPSRNLPVRQGLTNGDPLQRFLDRKRAEQTLVNVNLRNGRPLQKQDNPVFRRTGGEQQRTPDNRQLNREARQNKYAAPIRTDINPPRRHSHPVRARH